VQKETGELEPTLAAQALTVPNLISASRLVLVPVFAVLIAKQMDGWALFILAISGASDWLDGFLARRWNQQTKLGELLDPAADRLYILVTLLGLAWREMVPWWLVAVIVLRDLLLLGTVPTLRKHKLRALPVHIAGKAGTFALLYAFPLILLSNWEGTIGVLAAIFGWAFAIWGIGLYWYAGAIYYRQTALLAKSLRT